MSNLNPLQQTEAHMKTCIKSYIFDLLQHTEINSLASGGCRNGQGLTSKSSASAFWKAKLIFIHEKKKAKVKVHLQNFWNQKGPEKLKCSFWNFEITMCLWNIFVVICGKIQGQFVITTYKNWNNNTVSELTSMLELYWNCWKQCSVLSCF